MRKSSSYVVGVASFRLSDELDKKILEKISNRYRDEIDEDLGIEEKEINNNICKWWSFKVRPEVYEKMHKARIYGRIYLKKKKKENQ